MLALRVNATVLGVLVVRGQIRRGLHLDQQIRKSGQRDKDAINH
jgi:hypothetical protein